MDQPRAIALDILNRVEEGGWAAELLPRRLAASKLDERDRRFATELVNGTLRRRLQLDHVLAQLSKYPLEELDQAVRNTLRLGAYQIMHMRVPSHAACDQSVRLLRRVGPARATGLVNGVLRNLVRRRESIDYPDRDEDPAGWISVTESHPLWVVTMWIEELGFEETLRLCRANNEPATVQLRVNRLGDAPAEIPGQLRARGMQVSGCDMAPDGLHYSGGGSPFELPEYREGRVSVQSESSQMGALALGVRPGMRVLDACAGRGGKTTYLAEQMGDCGEIVAVDRHRFKLEALERDCDRLQLTIVRTLCADATDLPGDLGTFDAVLVDAPCSGLGILGRHPEARWQKGPKILQDMPVLQRKILDAVSSRVRPGGVLTYCTCSIARAENARVVQRFLQEQADYAPGALPPTFAPVAQSSPGMLQMLPHVHGSDGFFIARLQRTQEGSQ